MAEDTEAYYKNPNIVRQGRSIRERPKVDISPEAMEMAAGFHPLIGPALSARDFATAGREGDAAGMGLAALGMIPVAGGMVKPASRLIRTGINSLIDAFPTINIPGKISRLEKEALDKSGVYGQQRVQRAADEIPNLEKLYQEKVLRDTFISNNKALMTMNPKDFENFAPRLDKYIEYLVASPNATQFGSFDAYITHLSKVGAFNEIPQLTVAAPRVLGGIPEIVNHDGRHRSRALAQAGNEKSLVTLVDNPDMSAGLLPWQQKMLGSQEENISSLKDALGERVVRPQGPRRNYRGPEQLPDIYASGGSVQMPQEYSQGSWKLI